MSTKKKPTVFISHKAQDPDSDALLKKIVDELDAEFTLQVDVTGLRAGREWQDNIERWLLQCDASILLLTPGTAGSHWVQFETSFLCLRRRRVDRNLVILPVPLGGTKLHQLPQEFEKSKVAELQAVIGADHDAIVAALRKELQPVKDNLDCGRESSELERDLIHIFDKMRPDVILDAAEKLGFDRSELDGIADKSAWLARKLFGIDIDCLDAVIGALPEELRATAGKAIVALVAPFCWIDAQAAARIPEVAGKPESERGAGLNTENPKTAHMYIRRACRSSRLWPNRDTPPTWSGKAAADLIENVRHLVKTALGYLESEPVSPEQLRDDLLDETKKGPVLVVLPAAVAKCDGALLAQLMNAEDLKLVTFLVLLGQVKGSEFDRQRFKGVEFIEPELDFRQEQQIHRKVRKMLNPETP